MEQDQVYRNFMELTNGLALAVGNRLISPEQASYICKNFLYDHKLLLRVKKEFKKKEVVNNANV